MSDEEQKELLIREFGDNYKKVMGEKLWTEIEDKIKESEEISQGGKYRLGATLSNKKR